MIHVEYFAEYVFTDLEEKIRVKECRLWLLEKTFWAFCNLAAPCMRLILIRTHCYLYNCSCPAPLLLVHPKLKWSFIGNVSGLVWISVATPLLRDLLIKSESPTKHYVKSYMIFYTVLLFLRHGSDCKQEMAITKRGISSSVVLLLLLHPLPK